MSKTYKDNREYNKSSKSRGYYNRKNRRQFKDTWKKKDWQISDDLEDEEYSDKY